MRWLALLVACGKAAAPPAPAATDDEPVRVWSTVVVSECGYSLQMPGHVTRTVEGATTRYTADTPSKLVTSCTIYSGDPPPLAQLVHGDVEIVGSAARYRIPGAHQLAGRVFVAGHQVREISADVTHDDDAGDLEHAVASYK
jgi:hypothetical protein